MKTRFLLFFLLFNIVVSAQNLTVATYNLRYKNAKDSIAGNAWSQRSVYVAQLIKFHGFEVFGTQEATYEQLQDLKRMLTGYDYVGVGREDGKEKGEFSAIFYSVERLKLLDSGTFWLSQNTDAPNVGWDAMLPRICTWAFFKDLSTGKKFYFYNTHFDHRGVVARQESAKLILSTIAKNRKYPAIFTGDLNVDQRSEAYRILTDNDVLSDSYEIAQQHYATNGTFNGFNATLLTESRIDHILVTSPIKVLKYGILTDTYRVKVSAEGFQAPDFPKEYSLYPSEARVPSDHFPVMVVVEF